MTENTQAEPTYASLRAGIASPFTGYGSLDLTAKPTDIATSGGPIEEALRYTADRLDRLEHVLGDLNAVVMRAGSDLEPILTDGSYDYPSEAAPTDRDPTPEDRRSTIARRIGHLGGRTDTLANAAADIRRRLEGILDAVEL